MHKDFWKRIYTVIINDMQRNKLFISSLKSYSHRWHHRHICKPPTVQCDRNGILRASASEDSYCILRYRWKKGQVVNLASACIWNPFGMLGSVAGCTLSPRQCVHCGCWCRLLADKCNMSRVVRVLEAGVETGMIFRADPLHDCDLSRLFSLLFYRVTRWRLSAQASLLWHNSFLG